MMVDNDIYRYRYRYITNKLTIVTLDLCSPTWLANELGPHLVELSSTIVQARFCQWEIFRILIYGLICYSSIFWLLFCGVIN